MIYEGEFNKGNFHGKGKMTFMNNSFILGTWENGKLIDKQFFFEDELEFKEKNWDYCTLRDRRFHQEKLKEIKPFDQV